MKVVTWTNTRAPDGYQVLARIFYDDGRVAPVDFHGRDLDAVKKRAEKWFADELEKARKVKANAAAVAERMRAARAARSAS